MFSLSNAQCSEQVDKFSCWLCQTKASKQQQKSTSKHKKAYKQPIDLFIYFSNNFVQYTGRNCTLNCCVTTFFSKIVRHNLKLKHRKYVFICIIFYIKYKINDRSMLSTIFFFRQNNTILNEQKNIVERGIYRF